MVHGAMVQTRDNSAFERRLANREPWSRAVHNGDLVGRLIIPRLNLRATVREGAGEDTLAVALGHISGTAFPGENGNVGIAGHRDTLFRALRKIAKNDQIQFQTLNGTYLYEVESTRIVSPQSVAVLERGDHPEITLVTCYPFHYAGSAPDRFVVKARLVSHQDQLSERRRSSRPPSRK
jgi:sortase A